MIDSMARCGPQRQRVIDCSSHPTSGVGSSGRCYRLIPFQERIGNRTMKRSLVLVAGSAVFCVAGFLGDQGSLGQLIPEPVARQHGLTRPWFTQVQMDTARARVRSMVLEGGALFVQTDAATLHAIDAENGQPLWFVRVGNPNYPSLGPAANDQLVAVMNGLWVYVLDRQDGKVLWQRRCTTVPGAAPALSEQRVYIPMVNGQVHSYRLRASLTASERLALHAKPAAGEQAAQPAAGPPTEQPTSEEAATEAGAFRVEKRDLPPLVCQSDGRAIIQPLVTRQTAGDEYVAWGTDRGFLFVGFVQRFREDRFPLLYRLETHAGISAQPAYRPGDGSAASDWGTIFIPSHDGHVYAVRERDGALAWRFSTGKPIVQPVVAISARLYVATESGGMYCLNADDGARVWWAPDIVQFVSASEQRIYAVDRLHRLCVLDAATGARLDALNVQRLPIRLVNDQTDRLYLATADGLIQCLHEIELAEPLGHKVVGKSAAGQEQPAEGESQAQPASPAPAGAENPFAPVGEQPGQAPPAGQPGGAGENPVEAAPNPFQ